MPKYKVSWATKPGVQPCEVGAITITAPDQRRAPGYALDEVSDKEGIPVHLLRVRSVSPLTNED